jgi:hypothetical protein
MPVRSQRRVAYRHLNQYIPLSENQVGAWPELTSIDPDTAAVGDPDVTLHCYGTSFAEGAVVVFDGGDQPTTFVSEGEVTTIVDPAAATEGSVLVCVRNLDDRETEDLSFTFTAAAAAVPILVSLDPTSSPLSPLMDLELLCYGPATNVYHADMWVMMDDVRYEYFSWSQAYLTIKIPKADLTVSGVRQVRVVDAAGESLPLPFTVEAAPPLAISSCIPNPIPAAHPTAVTVRGTSFDPTCEMNFDGLPLDPSQAVFVNSTTCQITAPSIWTEGPHELLVFSYTLGNSNVFPITVSAPVGPTLPALTSLNPATLPAGTMDWSIGVNGTGFVDGDTVYADDTPLPTSFFGVTYLNATMLASLMTVPTTIAITQRRGAETSPPLTFTVGPPLPVPAITSTSPASVVAGSPNTPLTVTGTGFDDQCQIRLNGSGKSTTFVSDTQLTGVIAASLMTTAGAIAVTVNNPNAGLSNEVTIPVTAASVPAPTITALNPTSAVAGTPSVNLTVTGANYDSTCKIAVDYVDLPTVFVSATELTGTMGTAQLSTAGNKTVNVRRDADQKWSGGASFTVTAAEPAGSWVTVFDETADFAAGANETGWMNYTFVGVIPMAALAGSGGTKIRLTLNTGTILSTIVDAMWVGNGGGADPFDFGDTPVQITVAGAGRFTIPMNSAVVTDEIDFVKDATNPLLISWQHGATTETGMKSIPDSSFAGAGLGNYYGAGSTAGMQDKSGFDLDTTYWRFVSKVEVFTAAATRKKPRAARKRQ